MARCRSSTSRPRHRTSRSRWTRPATRWPTRTRCSSRPTSSSAGRARPASSSPGGSCSPTASRACPAAARSSTSTTVEHVYLADIEHREEGGTPAIVESIRAGLVFQLKATVGTDAIRERETAFIDRALTQWEANPSIEILGSHEAERLSIVSFVVRHQGRYLHHNFVVAVLNDLFGIQSRGGCSCAGPYGHRPARDRPRDEPRVRARDRPRLRGDQARLGPGQLQLLHQRGGVRVHPRRGRPRRARGLAAAAASTRSTPRPACGATAPATPSRRSASTTSATTDGRMAYPAHRHREPESRLAEYLAEARTLLARPPLPLAGPTFDAGRRGPGLRGPALVPAPRGRVGSRDGRSGRDAVPAPPRDHARVTGAVLGLDLGTSEAKAILVGLDGTLVGLGRAPIRTELGQDGRAEQDPRDWWRACASAVRAIEPARRRGRRAAGHPRDRDRRPGPDARRRRRGRAAAPARDHVAGPADRRRWLRAPAQDRVARARGSGCGRRGPLAARRAGTRWGCG